jgi:hypothetical protein
MTLANWFNSFCDNLKITNEVGVSLRYRAITRRLNKDFWQTESETAHSLYVGSYGRNTATGGFSDLDMIMQLPYSVYLQHNSYNSNGQSALLQAVKKSIENTYSKTSIRADGQVILVPFDDGITFEVVPGFLNTDNSFTYPNANAGGSWKTTNPRPEIEAIRARNKDCNNNLVQLARMMRAWKSHWDVPIGGLLLDTFVYQFIEHYVYREYSYSFYDLMCRDFFFWMANQNENQEFWRAPGSRQHVYGKGLFQYKAKRCYNLSVMAIDHASASPKREWSAKQKWREIFGAKFPT